MIANPARQRIADGALLLVACVWGASFPITALLLEHLPPFRYLAARFACASALLLAVFVAQRRPLAELRLGVPAGVALALAYATQTVGLPLTGPTIAGFLTGLSVLLVPPVGLLFGQRTARRDWIAVAAGTAGLALLTMREGGIRFGTGELLLTACAIAIAFQIVLCGRAAPRTTALGLSTTQNLLVFALCAAAIPFEKGPAQTPPLWVWAVTFGFGAVASAGAFAVQGWAQRFTPPAHVGLIFTAEPLSAALFSWWWLGERLSLLQWIGAAVLIAAIVYAETSKDPSKTGAP